MVRPPDTKQRAVRQGDYKFVEDGGLRFLFNVRTDPGERHDLAGREPARVAAMRALVAAWEKDVDEEAKAAAKNSRTAEGRGNSLEPGASARAQRVEAPLAGAGRGEIEEHETEDAASSPPLATGQNPRGRCAWK